MKKAFTLIEVLISVFVFALAIIGMAAVYGKVSARLNDNRKELDGIRARRNAQASIASTMPPLVGGWNAVKSETSVAEMSAIHFIYLEQSYVDAVPHGNPIIVTVSYTHDIQPVVIDLNGYQPEDDDIIISWWGNHHIVKDGTVQFQEFEKSYPAVLIPKGDREVVSIGRTWIPFITTWNR